MVVDSSPDSGTRGVALPSIGVFWSFSLERNDSQGAVGAIRMLRQKDHAESVSVITHNHCINGMLEIATEHS